MELFLYLKTTADNKTRVLMEGVHVPSHLLNAFGRGHYHANGDCTQAKKNASVRLHILITANVSITGIYRAKGFHLGLVRLVLPLETIRVNCASVILTSF